MALFSTGSSHTYQLSSRSFRVKCNNNLSCLYTSFCYVPQGSVLDPLFFIMYTTPLSTPMFPFCLTTTIYADDSQLFFSFHPLNFDSSITHLQNALQLIPLDSPLCSSITLKPFWDDELNRLKEENILFV